MKTRWTFFFVLLVYILSPGCQSDLLTGSPLEHDTSLGDAPIAISSPDISSQETPTSDRINATLTKLPERVPPTETTTPVTGEVPNDILDSILKDLAGKTSTSIRDIVLIQSQAVVWNDGSFGCPQPGVLYTQALVNGYWIILEVAGQRFDYRAANTGYFFLCENGLPPIYTPGTPDS
jgi:hypothetical protein